MGLAWCAFLRSKKVLIIIKPVPFWAICAFYTLILKWPEGQQTKQLRKLIVKQMKIFFSQGHMYCGKHKSLFEKFGENLSNL